MFLTKILFENEDNKKTITKLKVTIQNLETENKNLLERVQGLTKETERLAGIMSSNNTGCMVGSWCEDCDHVRRDKTITNGFEKMAEYGLKYFTLPTVDGYVTYCAKHLHDLCPEHSRNNQEVE